MFSSTNKFKTIVCGGTFDLFHKGHKDFLHTVFKYSDKVAIGLTSDKFALSQKNIAESFSIRKRALENFLKENKYNAQVLKIDDIYGPTLKNKFKCDAIAVTEDSLKGADAINKKRKELGFNDLKIIKIILSKSSDGKIVSSNRIRNGEIDRNGELFVDKKLLKYDYILPQNLRKKLSEPFGKLIENFDKWANGQSLEAQRIITVGDAITSKFVELKIIPKLCVIDLNVNRKKKFKNIYELGFENDTRFVSIINPAGEVSSRLLQEIKKFFRDNLKDNLVIKITGEDDLAVIPVVLSSPLGYEIYYGQPGRGVVKIMVSEKIKSEIKILISKFKRKVL